MWQKPWTYKKGILIAAALFITGILLQMTIGKIDWNLLAFPTNVILLVLFLAFLTGMHLLTRKVYLFRWMGSYPPVITAMPAVVLLTVIMGLTRQLPP